jgi:hypothetical protein
MTITPGLRKFALVVHLTSSVGWIGAVAVASLIGHSGGTSWFTRLVLR